MYPEVNCTKNTEILKHCSCSISPLFQQITNSQNNKKTSVGGKFQSQAGKIPHPARLHFKKLEVEELLVTRTSQKSEVFQELVFS